MELKKQPSWTDRLRVVVDMADDRKSWILRGHLQEADVSVSVHIQHDWSSDPDRVVIKLNYNHGEEVIVHTNEDFLIGVQAARDHAPPGEEDRWEQEWRDKNVCDDFCRAVTGWSVVNIADVMIDRWRAAQLLLSFQVACP